MKRLICTILALFLLLLAGCSSQEKITGVWEQEMEMSVLGLGVEEPATVLATARFTFREDGTGSLEMIITDDTHTNSAREFSYHLAEDTLTLDCGEDQIWLYTVALEGDSLTLSSDRGQYDLARVKS